MCVCIISLQLLWAGGKKSRGVAEKAKIARCINLWLSWKTVFFSQITLAAAYTFISPPLRSAFVLENDSQKAPRLKEHNQPFRTRVRDDVKVTFWTRSLKRKSLNSKGDAFGERVICSFEGKWIVKSHAKAQFISVHSLKAFLSFDNFILRLHNDGIICSGKMIFFPLLNESCRLKEISVIILSESIVWKYPKIITRNL